MNPKFIIVSENDEIIGEKDREAIRTEDIYRVSALWIKNSKGESLLARRAFTKSHDPGKWGPAVAGTVESGETYRSNIVKEAKEELGLVDIDPNEGLKQRTSGKYNYFGQWYHLTLDRDITDFKIQKDEVAEIKWFSKEELIKDLKEKPDDFLGSMQRYVHLFA